MPNLIKTVTCVFHLINCEAKWQLQIKWDDTGVYETDRLRINSTPIQLK